MKTITIISAFCILIFAGCTKHLSSLNINPKSSSAAIPTALFLQGEKNLVDNLTTTSVASAPFRVISQEWTENSYVYEAQYDFAPYQAYNGWWNNMYVNALHNLNLAKQAFPDDFKGDAVTLKNDLIITDILEIYTYYLLVATYGDIPYTEGLNTTIPFPKYDDAKTIYADLLTRIDTCISGINTAADAMGSSDQIYNGNTVEWKKFAASLKLKMALLNADTDPSTSGKKINEAVTAGVFTSNDDNALFSYDPSSPANSNPIWQALDLSGRHDFAPANLLVSTMVKWNDPRVPLYFTQFPAGSGKYLGGSPGLTNGFGTTSDFSSQLQQPDYPGDILDYPEVEFYLAEAAARGFISGGTTTTTLHYNNAITASIEFWGGSASDASTYLGQPAVNYATAAGPWQQKIGYQEWIAFYNRNWDAWTEIRRLGYPNLNVVSPPVGALGNLPFRFVYPSNEQTSNPINWDAAVKKLQGGKDDFSVKLFWEK